MKKELNVIDLFCGAGGLSTGFKEADFNILLGIDHDKKAIQTFIANHLGTQTISDDMTKIKIEEIKEKINNQEIDVIIGGPPCQGFSMAGKRQPNDPRNSLFKEYLRIVRELKPKAFVMENVRGLLSMKNEKGKKVIEIILDEFGKMPEYSVICHGVNTADYGVPQRRQRIFIIGVNKKYNFIFPKATHSKYPEKTGLKRWIGIGEVLLKQNQIDDKYFYSTKLINGFLRREKINRKKGVGFGWQFNNLTEPSYTISARYWKDGAESLIKYDERTIRMLTPLECARVQSFPSNYVFKGGEKDIYFQIGNAVPPAMAKTIAKSIKSALNT